MAIDKKMSQFTEVTALDETTEIIIIQGNPLDNKRIKKDNFKVSMGIPDVSDKMDVDGLNSEIENLKFKTDQSYPVVNTGEFG